MRILFVTETVPYPLDSGGRIKTYHTLHTLSAEHEVHCHAFIREPSQQAAADALRKITASVSLHLVPRSLAREGLFAVRGLIGRVPYSVLRHYDRRVAEALAASCAETRFDAIYCDHLSMMEYARPLGLPVIHDAHNVEFQIVRRFASTAGWGPKRLAAEFEWRHVRRYETDAYRRCQLIYAVSDIDAAEIRTMAGPGPRIEAVPIAVDAASQVAGTPWKNGPSVLFVGSLDWPPNRDAVSYLVEAIWPLVRQQLPAAQLTVVGRGTPSTSGPGVTYSGWVEDVAPYFNAARLLAVPIRSGSGMRVKILESLARGVPVVTTSVGVEGIAATDGVHVSVGDTTEAFATALVRLLGDSETTQRLSENGRRLALEHYDRQVVARRVLDSLASARANGILRPA